MGVFQQIVAAAAKDEINFLIIGGLAVNYYGVSRDTADLDLLVRQAERERWRGLLAQLGYAIYVERPTFAQFSPPRPGTWPVDLMLVQDATFGPMFKAGVQTTIYEAEAKVVSLEHLLALKLHALKHSNLGRYHKDLLDVESLVRANSLDLAAEETRRLFLTYGTVEIYEQVSRFAAGG